MVVSFGTKKPIQGILEYKEEKLKKLLPVFMILVCLGFVGCSKFGGEKKAQLSTDVVAQVGDEKIMASDIEEILSHIPPQYRTRYSTQQGRKEIVDGLVEIKMLALEARNRGLDKKDSVKMKITYLTDQTLAKELENELRKTYQVSDADIQKYYQEHQEKYVSPERIKASHILVDSQAQADTILKQIRKGGNFEALAKQYSKDSSASRGGDLGWFSKGRMDPAFESVAFALKKGEVSNVVKTPFGYHIIKLDDRKDSVTRPMDQLKRPIERAIQRDRMEKEVNNLKEGIRKKATVAVNDEYFKKFPAQSQTVMPEMGMPGMQPPAQGGPAAPRLGPVPAPAMAKPGPATGSTGSVPAVPGK
jgi:peptidyl-prolyl cis-trans isomerase C